MKNRSTYFCFLFVLVFLAGCQSTANSSDLPKISKSDSIQETVESKKVILFFGNSLTAGYGLELKQAFPALIGQRIDSLGLNYKVVNAGLSGETTSGGLERLDWVLKQQVDVFVLELGANDGLRGIAPSVTEENLQKIIDKVRAKNPDIKIVLAGMMVPPNMGQDFAKAFNAVFPKLAEKNKIPLIPFLLEGVAGIRKLNLPDGIHPTAQGQLIVRENVWKVLHPIL